MANQEVSEGWIWVVNHLIRPSGGMVIALIIMMMVLMVLVGISPLYTGEDIPHDTHYIISMIKWLIKGIRRV